MDLSGFEPLTSALSEQRYYQAELQVHIKKVTGAF